VYQQRGFPPAGGASAITYQSNVDRIEARKREI
jgi:hypothetical protein